MGLITMTAVTGKPSKERIFEYLTGIKENGISDITLYQQKRENFRL